MTTKHLPGCALPVDHAGSCDPGNPEVAAAMFVPVYPIEVIEAVLDSMGEHDPEPAADTAQRILDALAAAGVEVIAPQDIAWGTCRENGGGQHEVSLTMCVYCLEYDPE